LIHVFSLPHLISLLLCDKQETTYS